MTVTRDECFAAAGRAFAEACAYQDALTPRQAAEEAYRPGGPSIDELERLIRAQRAQTQALQQQAS